jgi:teichuronic acid exporter
MSSIKEKTVKGLFWSFIDNFSSQGITFIVGIILARLLEPKDFGLIGMITIFIAISQSFIDSGFSQALIRKNDCKQEDYSTAFYYNIIVGFIFYFILFFSAGAISSFFNEPQLLLLVRVIGINLLINSAGLIQRTTLTKKINFKLQTKISIISSVLSGSVGITMAFMGWGVWSLVWKTISQNIFTILLLWFWNNWIPTFSFSIKSFKEMFGFGSKLLLSGLIDTIYKNGYYFVIGKFFSANELGYYTRADQFSQLPSSNLTGVIQRVSYPVLSTIQNDPKRLKKAYQKLIKSTMFITFILMIGLAAIAKPLILTLIGEKWLPSVVYLQLLCFSGILYPLHALNLNILNVKGRSDLFLKLEIIKKILAVPIIIIGIFLGVREMIIGMILISFIAYFLNSFWSGKLVNYPVKEQIKDILPMFFLAIFMGVIISIPAYFLSLKSVYILLIQISLGALIIISISKLLKIEAYMEIRKIMINAFSKKSNSV